MTHVTPQFQSSSRLLPSSAAVVPFYWLFVVYGSLIPFDFRPIDFGLGWARFQTIEFLDLAVVSRADWIANILLYIPLAFLLCNSLCAGNSVLRRVWAIIGAGTLCVITAIAVEFTQQFAPPRTVSLNDLVAEGIGTAIGIGAWLFVAPLKAGLTRALGGGGRQALQAGLLLYAGLYVALSFFPFDFVVSKAEFDSKLMGTNYGLLVTPGFWSNPIRRFAVILGECVSIAPLGALISLRFTLRPPPIGLLLFLGALIGIGLELAQLFLASGVSQGFSVLSRMFGLCLGAGIAHQFSGTHEFQPPRWTRAALLTGSLPYVMAVAALSGWFTAPWTFDASVLTKLQPENFLPFYYHYFSTETRAVASVLSVFGMFAPCGIGCWIWDRCGALRRESPGRATGLTLVFVGVVEVGKLFVMGKHPDPTNLLVAASSAYVAYLLCVWISGTHAQRSVAVVGALSSSSKVLDTGNPLKMLLGVVLLVFVAVSTAGFPIFQVALASGLIVYGATLWWKPAAFIFVVPALLPIFDFADRSGRFFWQEFDLVLAVTFAVLLLRTDSVKVLAGRPLPGVARMLWHGFVVVYGIGVIRGLLPMSALDANSFASYYSPYNALRVGKGVLWVWLLTPYLAAALANESTVRRLFIPGILTGFVATVAATLWERHVFVGLTNIEAPFRAMATFNDMHVGGGSIDAYLALSFPFVAACFLLSRRWPSITAGALFFAGGLCAFALTFSRINAAALVIAGLILMAGLVRHAGNPRRALLLVLSLGGVTTLVISAVVGSPFAQSRWSVVASDLDERTGHWRDSLAFKPGGVSAILFGAGTGSYPRLRLLSRDPRELPSTYQFIEDDKNRALEFGLGIPTFVMQRLPALASTRYELALRIRSNAPAQQIRATICTQSVQFSLDCVDATLSSGDQLGEWRRARAVLDVGRLLAASKPLYLALSGAAKNQALVAIDDVQLSGPDGSNELTNGDFERGHDRWYFTSDIHLHWHAFSMVVHLLLEQGWFGLIGFSILVGYCLLRLAGARERPLSYVLGASIVSCLVIGMTDSVLDLPRITFLFGVMLLAAIQTTRSGGRHRKRRRSSTNAGLTRD